MFKPSESRFSKAINKPRRCSRTDSRLSLDSASLGSLPSKNLGSTVKYGESGPELGKYGLTEIKKVDSQGRISLPVRWRNERLHKSSEVIVIEKGDLLLVKPRVKPDLTRHFDSVEVDLSSSDFTDYSRLKKTVLGRRGK